MVSIPVLSSTRHLKVVVYFGKNRFVPFSSICSVMKVSHHEYFDGYLVANNFIKLLWDTYITMQYQFLWDIGSLSYWWIAKQCDSPAYPKTVTHPGINPVDLTGLDFSWAPISHKIEVICARTR